METIEKIKRSDGIVDLKKEFKSRKVVLGAKEVKKLLTLKKIKKVYLSNTAPKFLLDFEELKKVEVENLEMNASELGKFLGKNFPISAVGILK